MSHLLAWRDARQGDRRRLQSFTCTDGEAYSELTTLGWSPPKHHKPYEYDVQLRIQRLRVPLAKRYTVRIGEDPEGIAAVCVSEEIERGAVHELCYGAVERRLRNKGGGYAQEMLADTFDQITARCIELGSRRAEVFGYIDPENHPSQRMAARFGLRHDSDVIDELGGPLQVWKRVLILPDPADL